MLPSLPFENIRKPRLFHRLKGNIGRKWFNKLYCVRRMRRIEFQQHCIKHVILLLMQFSMLLYASKINTGKFMKTNLLTV